MLFIHRYKWGEKTKVYGPLYIDSNTVQYSLPRRVLINVVISDKHFVSKYLEYYNMYAYIIIQKNS